MFWNNSILNITVSTGFIFSTYDLRVILLHVNSFSYLNCMKTIKCLYRSVK